MGSKSSRASGFKPVISNPHFRLLWYGQMLAQLSQHAIHFVQIVLIEHLTGSSVQMALMIFSFVVPGILFSPAAGVLVDHLPRKRILVASNALRMALVLLYVVLLNTVDGWYLLPLIYLVTFVASSIGQFFAPAEQAMIPHLLPREQLLTANSLFNLTMAISQAAGLIVVGPLLVKVVGIHTAFAVIGVLYGIAAVLLARLPHDHAQADWAVAYQLYRAGWAEALGQVREGWQFIVEHRRVLLAMINVTLVATFIMILAMVAPGFVTRVLGMRPEDAVFVFAPAGLGMLLVTYVLGRHGHRFRRESTLFWGLLVTGLAFGVLGWLGHGLPWQHQTVRAAMFVSLLLGLGLSTVHVISQTTLQEETPPDIRGRVFSAQYMLNNLLGLPPMLTIGALFDLFGIPVVLEWLGVLVVLFMAVYAWLVWSEGGTRRAYGSSTYSE